MILSKSALRLTIVVISTAFTSEVSVLSGSPQPAAFSTRTPDASPSNIAPAPELHSALPYRITVLTTLTIKRLEAAAGSPQSLTPATYSHL